MRTRFRYPTIRNIWDALFAPVATITDYDQRLYAQLLSSMLLVSSGVVVGLYLVYSSACVDDLCPDGRVWLGIITVALLGHILCRRGYIRLISLTTAIWGTLLIFSLALFRNRAAGLDTLDYLVVIVVFDNLFLSLRLGLTISAFHLLGILAFAWLLPGTDQTDLLRGPLSLYVVVTIFSTLATYFRNILEQHRHIQLASSTAALSASEERYRSLVAALAEGIILRDADGTIQTVNPGAERLFSLTPDQLYRRTPLDPRWYTLHEDGSPFPPDTHPTAITLHMDEPQRNIVIGIHKPDDTLTWLSVNSQPIFHHGTARLSAVVTSFSDITEHRLAEQRRIDLAVEHERRAILANFIQDASHEFRTPLAIIRSSTELMERVATAEKRQTHLHRITSQAERILTLVDDLVEMARLDTLRDLPRSPVNVNDLLTIFDQQLGDALVDKQLVMHLHLAEHLPNIQADWDSLVLALSKLFTNAMRYTPAGGTISVYSKSEGAFVVIELRDTGIGIAPEYLSRIFERFYRVDQAHSTAGFGLGLPIAQKIAELHGGVIEVESELGKGSTFRIRLPIETHQSRGD